MNPAVMSRGAAPREETRSCSVLACSRSASPAVAGVGLCDRLESGRRSRRCSGPARQCPRARARAAFDGTSLMVHVAVYDAVNAIVGGHEPYASKPDGPHRRTRRTPRSAGRLAMCSSMGGLNGARASRSAAPPSSRPPMTLRALSTPIDLRQPAGSPTGIAAATFASSRPESAHRPRFPSSSSSFPVGGAARRMAADLGR